jgi:hypothetical protein
MRGEPWQWFLAAVIYVIGVVVSAWLVGRYDESVDPDDIGLAAFMWPIALPILLLMCIAYGPVWIMEQGKARGDKIRGLQKAERAELDKYRQQAEAESQEVA